MCVHVRSSDRVALGIHMYPKHVVTGNFIDPDQNLPADQGQRCSLHNQMFVSVSSTVHVDLWGSTYSK